MEFVLSAYKLEERRQTTGLVVSIQLSISAYFTSLARNGRYMLYVAAIKEEIN
jgi:hypothetical protein